MGNTRVPTEGEEVNILWFQEEMCVFCRFRTFYFKVLFGDLSNTDQTWYHFS